MPLPLAPIAVFALRAGAVAAAAWAVRRTLTPNPGRTDQRAEDALDDLDEGLSTHAPADREGQRNAGLRLRRVVGWGKRRVEVDLGLLARLRVRGVAE
jgi:hypothetical protein